MQKGHFDRLETTAQQIEYVDKVTDYLVLVQQDGANLEELTTAMQSDGILKGKQLDARYLSALGDVAIMQKTEDGSTVFVGFVRDMTQNVPMDENKNYTMVISGTDADGVPFNAANDNFKDDGDISMRLWIRIAVTIVPAVFLLLSLLVQNKKFIIDEKYYDMMLEEIEKRKNASAQQNEQ